MVLVFLDNALKYTLKDGKITVSLWKKGRLAFLEIKDSGIGISEKDLPHIFERFYRVDQSRSKLNIPAFGLGLSLAKRIIELHKGSVEVESIEGKGTTFTIKFPLKHS